MRHRIHLIALAWFTMTSPAWAHAFLERAVPPVGSDVSPSPPQLELTFTEGVEPLFSSVQLHNAQGTAVSIGKVTTAPGNDRVVIIKLPTLPTGSYTVIWHATSVDTHKTEGNFKFTVK
jgi:methionine-rich copper-binding protein CopC